MKKFVRWTLCGAHMHLNWGELFRGIWAQIIRIWPKSYRVHSTIQLWEPFKDFLLHNGCAIATGPKENLELYMANLLR